MFIYRILRMLLPVTLLLASSTFLPARQGPKLSEEQIKEFLRTAKVVDSKRTSKGVTAPYQLTMTDGTITHDAGFNYVDEDKAKQVFNDGHVEFKMYPYKADQPSVRGGEIAKLQGLDLFNEYRLPYSYDGNEGGYVNEEAFAYKFRYPYDN